MEDGRIVPLRNAPVARGSEEWIRLEYLLQLSLGSTAAKVTAVHSVAAPHLTVQFESRTAGKLILDSWVDTRHLGEMNTLADVCTRGFRFPASGMIFPTGVLVLPNAQTSRVQEVLLCKVGVGHSLAIEEEQLLRRPPLPEGFNSYYIHKSDGDNSASNSGAYYHEYLILDPSQVLPCYIVQFEIGPDETVPICDVCNERPAVTFCAADNARLCHQCDEDTHSANKLVSRHVRVPLHEAPATAKCNEHNVQADYFDSITNSVVCVHCKMVGSHSTGENAQHRLISLSEAYKTARQIAAREDPLLESRKSTIGGQLRAVDDRLRAVRGNSQAVEEAIYQALQDALTTLQTLTQRKLTALLGEELELRRQMQQIEWVENFASMASNALPPTRFLTVWRAHAALRSELQHPQPTKGPQEIHADLQLHGSVSVVSGESAAMQPAPQLPADVAQMGATMGAMQLGQARLGMSGMGGMNGLNPGGLQQPQLGQQQQPAPSYAPASTPFRQTLFGGGGLPAFPPASFGAPAYTGSALTQPTGVPPSGGQQQQPFGAQQLQSTQHAPQQASQFGGASLSAASYLHSPGAEADAGSPYIRTAMRF
eukprot:TRINITY_DN9979_c0_g1_i1.p1 TRINITY_DN9979_c0_g1~~TRINITY_DN9979_c0_g1_i1.p1  ORF type:complete len:611 (-),score=136.11 TRINITY_DN9979_c0_g1_i1:121-1908(-)